MKTATGFTSFSCAPEKKDLVELLRLYRKMGLSLADVLCAAITVFRIDVICAAEWQGFSRAAAREPAAHTIPDDVFLAGWVERKRNPPK
jgi:hypothetical protein